MIIDIPSTYQYYTRILLIVHSQELDFKANPMDQLILSVRTLLFKEANNP